MLAASTRRIACQYSLSSLFFGYTATPPSLQLQQEHTRWCPVIGKPESARFEGTLSVSSKSVPLYRCALNTLYRCKEFQALGQFACDLHVVYVVKSWLLRLICPAPATFDVRHWWWLTTKKHMSLVCVCVCVCVTCLDLFWFPHWFVKIQSIPLGVTFSNSVSKFKAQSSKTSFHWNVA